MSFSVCSLLTEKVLNTGMNHHYPPISDQHHITTDHYIPYIRQSSRLHYVMRENEIVLVCMRSDLHPERLYMYSLMCLCHLQLCLMYVEVAAKFNLLWLFSVYKALTGLGNCAALFIHMIYFVM